MTTKKEQNAKRIEDNKRNAYAAKVRKLTGFLYGRLEVPAMLAAYEGGVSADDYAVTVATQYSPVGAAVHPLKVEAIKHAADAARAQVERVRVALARRGFDINAAAPYSRNASCWDIANEHAKNRNRFYGSLTSDDPARRAPNYFDSKAPHFVIMNADKIARYVSEREKAAAAQYDAFICKLVGKVGECLSARIEGSHVWGNSTLYVMKQDGNETYGERWHTKQIVNYSKFGEGFYQWPSRLMK